MPRKIITWISEVEAAERMHRQPKYFRSPVKSGHFNIGYRSVNGRSYEYVAEDIEKVKNKEAVTL